MGESYGILALIANWMIYTKVGEPRWKNIVPFYNMDVLFDLTWGTGWLFLLTFIPITNIVIMIITYIKLAQAFGQPGGFAVGLSFLPNIFLLILAFDSSLYIGPHGVPRIPQQNDYNGSGYDNNNPYDNNPYGGYNNTSGSGNPNDPYSGTY